MGAAPLSTPGNLLPEPLGCKFASSVSRATPGSADQKQSEPTMTNLDVTRGGGDAASGEGAPPSQEPFARPRFHARRAYAALDLGTNNCRMLIARPERRHFQVLDAFSRIVRLGEGLGATGRLSDAAMDRAVAALSICAQKLVRRDVTLSRAVATEACRRASNGEAFVARVFEETGIRLDIIPPEEEARLAMLGCHTLLGPGTHPALVFDIGGGSTELVLVDTEGTEPRSLDWHSMPWGVVSLSETEPHELESEEARLAAYDRMKAQAAAAIAPFVQRIGPGPGQRRLLGTSGTVTTLSSVYLKLPSYDRARIDGLSVPVEDMRQVCADLARLSVRDRARQPCIGRERADLVVAGCAILEAILDIWPAENVGVADRGLREGIIRQLILLDRGR